MNKDQLKEDEIKARQKARKKAVHLTRRKMLLIRLALNKYIKELEDDAVKALVSFDEKKLEESKSVEWQKAKKELEKIHTAERRRAARRIRRERQNKIEEFASEITKKEKYQSRRGAITELVNGFEKAAKTLRRLTVVYYDSDVDSDSDSDIEGFEDARTPEQETLQREIEKDLERMAEIVNEGKEILKMKDDAIREKAQQFFRDVYLFPFQLLKEYTGLEPYGAVPGSHLPRLYLRLKF